MKIGEYNFHLWCIVATAKIRYGPDRRAVQKELLAHLEDHRDVLMQQGVTEEEASRIALETMGSAEELAPQFAAIHKPFWGYFLRVNLILMAILCALAIWPFWDYITDLNLYDRPNTTDFDIYSDDSYGGNQGQTLLHLSHPNTSATSDGNTFTLTDVALFTLTAEDGATGGPFLHFSIRQTSLLPWAEVKEYCRYNSEHVTRRFFARDDRGNYYKSMAGYDQEYRDVLIVRSVQSGIFTATHEFWIDHIDPDAKWVDVCYERDGRSFSLRIHLTGGDGT